MVKVLPQQRLLLELLTMSGDIAVLGPPDDSLLWRTLEECKKSAWLKRTEINPGLFNISIMPLGRSAIKR